MIERRAGEYTTHETRAEANETVDKVKRYTQIIECLREKTQMTAKEIAVRMCEKGYIPTTERNFTAPRLTEMSQRGLIEPLLEKRNVNTQEHTVVHLPLREE